MVGISELGWAILKPKAVTFLDVDSVEKEQPFAELTTERGKIALRSPISGKIVDKNEPVIETLKEDTYEKGFLIKVEPSKLQEDLKKLVTGDAIKEWAEKEADFLSKGEYAFKIVEVGESSVGKTAIKVRFTDDYFKKDLKSTLGIDFGSKVIDTQYVSNDVMMHSTKHLNIKCNVWDFGGQKVYAGQRKMYYGSAKGCLLVFDVTNPASFNSLPEWIKEIEENAGKIPTLLVGNKIDLVDDRKVSKADAEKFAKDHGYLYYESSALDGTGVTEAFTALALEIYKDVVEPES